MNTKPLEVNDKAIKLAEEAGQLAANVWPVVETAPDYDSAAEARIEAKKKINALNDQRLEITRPMDEAKKKVKAFFDKPVAALNEFITQVDRAMLPYIKRKEEEDRQARIKAEKEAEEKRRKEEEENLSLAAEMEELGESELAEEIIATTPATAEAEQVESVKAKASGTSTRKTLQVECFDVKALIKDVAAGNAPASLLTPDIARLKNYCNATEKAPAGCKISWKTSIVSRTK